MDEQLIAPLSGDAVSALADWASLCADLLHVDMTLLARAEMPADGEHLFARRALWEAAASSYGRTAMTGRRQQHLTDLISSQGPQAVTCHADVMASRNQHVAHRVDEPRERVEIGAIIDPVARRVRRINVRIEPTWGPEDEDDDLVQRFQAHVRRLRDQIWEKHLPTLEQRALEEQSDHVDQLLASGRPFAAARGFAIRHQSVGARLNRPAGLRE